MTRKRFLAGLSVAGAAALPVLGRQMAWASSATPEIEVAVASGALDRVRALLDDQSALLGHVTAAGLSLLSLALTNGHAEVAALLMERGAEPDLAEAALLEDKELVDAVGRAHPALVNAAHPLGGAPMHVAVRRGKLSMLTPLSSVGGTYNSNPANPPGTTPVREAIDHPDLELAEDMAVQLLGNGGDPNAPQADGVSILHRAAARGSEEVVHIAMRKGARLDARDPSGRTPLDVAREAGHGPVVELLSHPERTPLDTYSSRYAYRGDGARFVREACTLPAALINEFSGYAHFNYDEVKRLLGEHPSLLNSEATWAELPIEAAAHMDRPDDARYLIDQGAPLAMPTATMLGRIDHVRMLLDEEPARVRERGAHDIPLMWYAMMAGGQPDVLALLIERGIDVNQEKRGMGALHHAARFGYVELGRMLIEAGADVNMTSRRGGHTPLAMAQRAEAPEMVALLERHGARAG